MTFKDSIPVQKVFTANEKEKSLHKNLKSYNKKVNNLLIEIYQNRKIHDSLKAQANEKKKNDKVEKINITKKLRNQSVLSRKKNRETNDSIQKAKKNEILAKRLENKAQKEIIDRKQMHKELVEIRRQLQMERLAANRRKKTRKYEPKYRVDYDQQLAKDKTRKPKLIEKSPSLVKPIKADQIKEIVNVENQIVTETKTIEPETKTIEPKTKVIEPINTDDIAIVETPKTDTKDDFFIQEYQNANFVSADDLMLKLEILEKIKLKIENQQQYFNNRTKDDLENDKASIHKNDSNEEDMGVLVSMLNMLEQIEKLENHKLSMANNINFFKDREAFNKNPDLYNNRKANETIEPSTTTDNTVKLKTIITELEKKKTEIEEVHLFFLNREIEKIDAKLEN